MKKQIKLLTAFISVFFIACAIYAGCAMCEKGKSGKDIWCKKCKVGYISSEAVKCKKCFAGKVGQVVWCKNCKKGYIKGKATECEGCVKAVNNLSECKNCE